jgi:hypothetical protein
MTRLEQLKVHVEALPLKRERTRLVEQLRKYGTDLSKAREELVLAAAQTENARHVFPEIPLRDVDESVKKAANAARKLRSILQNQIEDIRTAGVEKRVVTLKDYARSASTGGKEQWKGVLGKHIASLRPLVEVARDARLEGSEPLQRQLDALTSREAPRTPQDAMEIKARLEQLKVSVASLGLEDVAGRFLMRAVEGTARPKDLEDPEVRKALDRFQLWDRLSIRLG